MSGDRLSGFVLAQDPDGNRVILNPADPLPKWANRETIPNPKAWTEQATEVAGPDTADGSAGGQGGTPPAGDADTEGTDKVPDESWTVNELREYAAAQNPPIDLSGKTVKADILAAVTAG